MIEWKQKKVKDSNNNLRRINCNFSICIKVHVIGIYAIKKIMMLTHRHL